MHNRAIKCAHVYVQSRNGKLQEANIWFYLHININRPINTYCNNRYSFSLQCVGSFKWKKSYIVHMWTSLFCITSLFLQLSIFRERIYDDKMHSTLYPRYYWHLCVISFAINRSIQFFFTLILPHWFSILRFNAVILLLYCLYVRFRSFAHRKLRNNRRR